MGIKFIGQFLLERGVIRREQLLMATQLQDSRNRSLGALGVERGYLTVADADRINREQQTTDRRFGELALSMGLLTSEQIEELLTRQKASRIRIGEALVEIGAITADAFETEFKAFQADQAIYQTTQFELPAHTPAPEFVRVSVDLTEKLLLRMAGLTGKRGVPEMQAAAENPELLHMRIPFSGKVNAQFAFSASADVAAAIARRVLGDSIVLTDELAFDALKEFCNVVCGNVCGKLSEADSPLEIGPPEDGLGVTEGNSRALLVPMHLPDGTFELHFFFG